MPLHSSIRSVWVLAAAWALAVGCGSSSEKPEPYFTSGSHEADQRAEQRIAQAQQARGDEEGEEGKPRKLSLYEGLGGEQGINLIVDDFVARVLADPRVNWGRKGVTGGGFAGIGEKPAEWQASGGAVARLKKHMAQFIAVATGGPAQYNGRQMSEVHRGMKITNAEFDAAIGDLKATLDKLGVATSQQRELLAIFESTRAQIVEER